MNRKDHLLLLLMEECAEVQQACSKILRFGMEDSKTPIEPNNEEKLLNEIYDLLTVLDVIHEEVTSLVLDQELYEISHVKRKKIEKWIKYSKEKGKIHDN